MQILVLNRRLRIFLLNLGRGRKAPFSLLRLDELFAEVTLQKAWTGRALGLAFGETCDRGLHGSVLFCGLVGDGLFPLCVGNGSDSGLGKDEADAHNGAAPLYGFPLVAERGVLVDVAVRLDEDALAEVSEVLFVGVWDVQLLVQLLERKRYLGV